MGIYQGRALRQEARRKRGGRLRRLPHVLGALALVAALAHVPWSDLRHRFAVLTDVDVVGLRYLGADQVMRIAGLRLGADLFDIDQTRVRQALLVSPRVARAEVRRAWLRRLRIRIDERVPVLLVRHHVPWEMDSTGVLLEPLEEGVVADVPMLTGADVESMRPGTQVSTPQVRRGISWVRTLSAPDLQLGGRVSEIDVSDDQDTALVLTGGTRVLSDAWPPDAERLSALRVVLADLDRRGVVAESVDLRFKHQVIVKPASLASGNDTRGRKT